MSLMLISDNLNTMAKVFPKIKATSDYFDCRKLGKENYPGKCRWVIEVKE